ncbi:F-box/kelch-repeat protein At3g23880-like [Abrus precatorius]|uniref:F-box/kelch-repeat protein At3g23880-like n=1 Tax=Abrus precatorius TaxID=3816 RepID=A0A8B8L4Z6_ABRPR|nr:F-box/kelch-repeat protein At3g23880-like [Abrus precatorius]
MKSAKCKLYLPHELVEQILSYIPAKALMRLRCVSKAWNDLVLDPTFVKLHLQRSSKNIHMLYTWKPLALEGFRCCPYAMQSIPVQRLLESPSLAIDGSEIPCEFTNNITHVIGTCNGLVCLRVIVLSPVNDKYGKIYIRLWNPATRITSHVSPPLELQLLSVTLGFGYDDSSDTYKVLALVMVQRSTDRELTVHCLGDKCWRKIASIPTNSMILQYKGHFLSGTLNWMARHGSRKHVIFSFDLRKETYRYFSIPEAQKTTRTISAELGILKGCLCLGAYNRYETHFALWQMKEYGVEESWTLLMKTIRLYFQIDSVLFPFFEPYPLAVYENGDVLLMLMNRPRVELLLYNKKDDRIEFVDQCYMKDNKMKTVEAVHKSMWIYSNYFVQTLVFPRWN